ncbi:MAG: hypothetical protein H6943_09280 [Zoogloeaceae bacterium]|nr:hypothetical protein [Zoogloeaceae bacterium]
MNNESTSIRHQFLAQACRYLFGQTANCDAFRHIGLGMPALQPIPISNQQQKH